MKKLILIVMVLLAGCNDYGPRKYELIAVSGSVYLVDIRTGRVWEKDLVSGAFEPKMVMMDSSLLVQMEKVKDSDTKKFLRENYTYQPNTWRDFFRGLGK
jgi:hypothetical protein